MSNPAEIIMEQRLETINKLGIKVGNKVALRDGRIAYISQIDLSHRTEYPITVKNTGSYTLEGKISIYDDDIRDDDIIEWDFKDGDVLNYFPVEDVFNYNTTSNFIKHDNGKPLISLIDPKFIEGLATVMTQGANKYGRDNWKECKEPHRYLDALLRHTLKYWDGEKVDTESGKSHLYHIAFNAMALDYLDNKLKD